MSKNIRVMASALPHCVVVIDKQEHAWYVVDKRTRSVLDYGSTHGLRAGAFLDWCGADAQRQRYADNGVG